MRFGRFAGAIAVATGLLVAAGWAFDVAALRTLVPGFPEMKLNAAIAFVLSGVSLYLLSDASSRSPPLARVVATAVALLGLLTLAEYAFGWDLELDELVVADRTGDTPYPGRIPLWRTAEAVRLAQREQRAAERNLRDQLVRLNLLGGRDYARRTVPVRARATSGSRTRTAASRRSTAA
jgi:hypothetical protein